MTPNGFQVGLKEIPLHLLTWGAGGFVLMALAGHLWNRNKVSVGTLCLLCGVFAGVFFDIADVVARADTVAKAVADIACKVVGFVVGYLVFRKSFA